MPYDYEILPAAQKHLEDSIEWYSLQSQDIAEDFINDVEQAIDKLCNENLLARRRYKHFSHFLLSKFPFTIIYTLNDNHNLITVRSIYHQKRSPQNKYR